MPTRLPNGKYPLTVPNVYLYDFFFQYVVYKSYLSVYWYGVLGENPKASFEITHKISYPKIEEVYFIKVWMFQRSKI